MKLHVDNTWTHVIEATRAEVDWLASLMTVVTRSGPVTMFERIAGGYFPTGFLRIVKDEIAERFVLELVDDRPRPCRLEMAGAVPNWALCPPLRDDQRNALADFLRRGARGVIKVPVGGGKTRLAIALTRLLPCEWLFVVPGKDLTRNAANELHALTGETAGTFTTGRWERGTTNMTVATFQTLAKAKKKFPEAYKAFMQSMQGVIVDEVHALPANTFFHAMLDLDNAFFRCGLSGTPFDREETEENLRTIGLVGPALHTVSYQELESIGVLSHANIVQVPFHHDALPEGWSGESWAANYRKYIVFNRSRNAVIDALVQLAPKPVMVFVEETRHGELLLELGRKWCAASTFVYGDAWDSTRAEVLRKLNEKSLEVVYTSRIFNQGVDVPHLASVVLAPAGKSVIANGQRLGRGSRRPNGKVEFFLYDIFDRGHPWFMRHAERRREAFLAAGHEVEQKSLTALLHSASEER